MADETQNGEGGAKKASPILMIAGVAILTLVGGGGGWVVGGMIAPKDPQPAAQEQQAAESAQGGEGEGKEEGIQPISTEANGIVLLDPITTNLAYPSDNWVRLEVALAFNGAPDLPMAENVHQDIMAYLRTVSLQQIEGPRGFQYLRDDLQERASLRSQGKVARVMLRTFVIE